MSQIPSLMNEVDELKEMDAFIMQTFKHCNNMKTDILEFSSDAKKDLTNFKNILVNLSEIQKDISGLACTVTRLDSYDVEDIGSDLDEISKTVDRIHSSAMEEQFVPDEVEKLLTSVDFYIRGQEDMEELDVEDSELQVTTTVNSYKDPITQAIIKDPVKSKTCKHVYCRTTIFRYMERSYRCPYSGCSTILTRDDLVDDLETKRKIMNMN